MRLISVVVVVVVVVEVVVVVVEVEVDVEEVSFTVSLLLGSSVSFVTVGGGGGGIVSFFDVSFPPPVVSDVSLVDEGGDDVSLEFVILVLFEDGGDDVSVTLLLSSVEFVSVGGELVIFDEVTLPLSSVELV